MIQKEKKKRNYVLGSGEMGLNKCSDWDLCLALYLIPKALPRVTSKGKLEVVSSTARHCLPHSKIKNKIKCPSSHHITVAGYSERGISQKEKENITFTLANV